MRKALPNGYSIREMGLEEFSSLAQPRMKEVFLDNGMIFSAREYLSEEEKAARAELGKRMGDPVRINLGLFHGDNFVGWSWGYQKDSDTFYMTNSAVLPAHRGQGLYKALMNAMVEVVAAKGFQVIYSRHIATNNAVIVPKLKAGFHITSFELSEIFGVLVHLTYFPNPLRRKVLIARTGDQKPDPEVRRVLGLE